MSEKPSQEQDAHKNFSSECASLREEIRKSEEARTDFIKYKLLTVATLAAVGLGLGKFHPEIDNDLPDYYVLAVIPFVCVYVDAVCYHNNLRIQAIAKFLRCSGDPYETFLDEMGKSTGGVRYYFELEDWIFDFSTRALAVLTASVGLFVLVSSTAPLEGSIVFISGFGGLFLSFAIKREYETRFNRLRLETCMKISSQPPSAK